MGFFFLFLDYIFFFKLCCKGIMGMNKCNYVYIGCYNDCFKYFLVDDKFKIKLIV